MTIEYWLQKKTVGGWSHVTYYSDELEARTNLDKVAIPNNGYSWRLVKAEVIEERMLEEVVEVTKPALETNEIAKAALWGKSVQDASKSTSGWGDTSGWKNSIPINPILNTGLSKEPWSTAKEEAAFTRLRGHGLAGKVWMINHSTKSKVRVSETEVQLMIESGYERGGPRTQFRS